MSHLRRGRRESVGDLFAALGDHSLDEDLEDGSVDQRVEHSKDRGVEIYDSEAAASQSRFGFQGATKIGLTLERLGPDLHNTENDNRHESSNHSGGPDGDLSGGNIS